MKIKISFFIVMLFVLGVSQKVSSQQLADAENAISISYLASPDTACAPFTGPIYFTVISLSTGKIHANVSPVAGAISYNWYINGSLNTTYHTNGCNFNVSRTNCDIEYDIAVEVIDSCGTSPQVHANAYMPCDNYFRISPNPAKSSINISVDETKAASSYSSQNIAGSLENNKSVAQSRLIYSVRIADKSGNVKKTVDFKSGVKKGNISLVGIQPGVYIVSIFDNISWKSQNIIIE